MTRGPRLPKLPFLQRVADVVESVTGAAYLSGGDELGLMACKAMGLPIPNVSRWSDFARKVTVPSPNEAYPIKQEHVDEIERTIGFKFSRPELLQLALVCVAKIERCVSRCSDVTWTDS